MTAMTGPLTAAADARETSLHAVPFATIQKLAERWPTLTREELDATHGRSELITALLRAKADYAEILTREALGQPLPRHQAAASASASWPRFAAPVVLAGALATLFGSLL
jgi:hypothetical protein